MFVRRPRRRNRSEEEEEEKKEEENKLKINLSGFKLDLKKWFEWN